MLRILGHIFLCPTGDGEIAQRRSLFTDHLRFELVCCDMARTCSRLREFCFYELSSPPLLMISA